MNTKVTKKQALAYVNGMVGKGYDWDNFAGFQCFDTVNYYWHYLFGLGGLKGASAKNIPFKEWNDFTGKATVYKNTPTFLAQAGDIFVYMDNWGNGHGHTGVVVSATLNSITVVEQNYYGGGADKTEVTAKRTHAYDPNMYFIRPNFKPEPTIAKKATNTIKQVVAKVLPTKKKKIVLVSGHGYADCGAVGNETNERDFIRTYITPNVAKYLRQVGCEVVLYGGSNQSQDLFQDTRYGVNIGNYKDYGMYWIKNKLKPEAIIEFHLDASSKANVKGGHVIKSAYSADEIDKNIDNVLASTVGKLRDITTRNDLLNVNVSYDLNLNYRLVELGFITSKADMDYIKGNIELFTRRLAEAICGVEISTQRNTYNWKGRFYPNTTIKVRKQAGLKGEVVNVNSWLYNKNDWVDFDQLIKKDGYWWGRFKYPTNINAGYFYCALTPITDKKERIKAEKKMYGKITWK